jgi:isopenicillin N synthase-like dioxygenase
MDNKEGRDEKGRFIEKNLWAHCLKYITGRPLMIQSKEELMAKVFDYFEWCDQNEKGKITFAGLRCFIGFSRESWSEYKRNSEFVDTMNNIEQMLEAHWEQKLGWAGSTQGAIFWLKNKAGWKDEVTQHQQVTNVEIIEKQRE